MKITNIEIDAITLTFRWNNTLIGLGQIAEIKDSKLLDDLSYVDNKSIKQEILANPNLNPKTLARLADDENNKICALVASNPNTPPTVLAKLSKRDHWTILLEVAKNSNTSSKILFKLSRNPDTRIRSMVAKNPKTCASTLDFMLEESIDKQEKDVLVSLAENENATFKVFSSLYNCEFVTVRRALASNPKIPIRFIKALSEDTDFLVRKNIIHNPSTSTSVLNAILKEESNKYLCTLLSKRLAS